MDDRLMEDVYDTLRGLRIPSEHIAGVENLFAPGGECDRLYAQMLDAYGRLLTRLGAEDEDADIEIILSSMMGIERRISHKMFFYGAEFEMK